MKQIFITSTLLIFAFFLSGCNQSGEINTADYFNNQDNGSGTQYVERDANGMVVSIDKKSVVNTPTSQNAVVNTSKEPTGMTKVSVINKETKRPVPGIGISIPYSSQMFYANNMGYTYIPYSYTEFSIPKINNYYAAGTVQNLKDGKELTVELQPEEALGESKVEYLTGFGKPSEDKSTYIYGTIKKSDGSFVANESVVVLKSNLNTKTDQNGNYKLNVVGESNSYRLYLPNLKNNVYYQVDIFKGYALNIDIKL